MNKKNPFLFQLTGILTSFILPKKNIKESLFGTGVLLLQY